MKDYNRTSGLKEIKISNSMDITNLLFVDNSLIFSYDSIHDIFKLKQNISLYCTIRGVDINLKKSLDLVNRISEDDVQTI